MMKPVTRFATLSLVALAATACAKPVHNADRVPTIARQQIKVAESVERLELYPNAQGMSLAPRDAYAMRAFLSSYARDGDGPIYINTPLTGGPGTQSAAAQVREVMASLGMGGSPVKQGRYPSVPGAPAPVIVSYRKLTTLVPDCRVSTNLTYTHLNEPSSDWGCAHAANIAAMVADPNQFLEPYPLGEPDAMRRMDVYDKYITGEDTSATRPANQNVTSQSGVGGGG